MSEKSPRHWEIWHLWPKCRTFIWNYKRVCANFNLDNSLAAVKKSQFEPKMSYHCKAFAKETVLHHSVSLLNNISVKRRTNNEHLWPDIYSSVHRYPSSCFTFSATFSSQSRSLSSVSSPSCTPVICQLSLDLFFFFSVRFRSTTVKWIHEKWREVMCLSLSVLHHHLGLLKSAWSAKTQNCDLFNWSKYWEYFYIALYLRSCHHHVFLFWKFKIFL